jgi:hypothetical protein
MAKLTPNNALKINFDEITSYKSFIANPQLLKDKILAIVKNTIVSILFAPGRVSTT